MALVLIRSGLEAHRGDLGAHRGLLNARLFHVHTLPIPSVFISLIILSQNFSFGSFFVCWTGVWWEGVIFSLFSILFSTDPPLLTTTDQVHREDRKSRKQRKKGSDARDHHSSKHATKGPETEARIGCIYSIFPCVLGRLGVGFENQIAYESSRGAKCVKWADLLELSHVPYT